MLKKVTACVLSLVLLCMSGSGFFANAADSGNVTVTVVHDYSYPITSASEQWDDYTVKEKVEMLRIPSETLECMTDEALVNAIADYPYLVDIYVYGDSVEDGLKVVREYFSALDELLSRNTASDALMSCGVDVANSYYAASVRGTEDGDSHNRFVANAMLDILEVVNEDVEVIYEDSSSLKENTEVLALVSDNRTLSVYNRTEEHTASNHRSRDQEVVDIYGVTLVSNGTCKYNCHWFAWRDQSMTGGAWLNDPTPCMTNDAYHYTRKYLGTLNTMSNATSIRSGDVIFYGDPDDASKSATWHSAIYTSNIVSGMPLATQMCRSKWGELGVFDHQMACVPAAYDVTMISAWRYEL